MIESMSSEDRTATLVAAGLSEELAYAWSHSLASLEFPHPSSPGQLDRDFAQSRPLLARAWELLGKLPQRSKRNAVEKRAGEAIVHGTADLCRRLARVHRRTMYEKLTRGDADPLRVDELLWRAAELWPGLLPTPDAVRQEAARKQIDKDGLEINQGVFISQLMSEPRIGHHLCHAMLAPTETARERLEEFVQQGRLDLGTVRVEAQGETGYVYFHHPRYLNAEDDETVGPQEVAVDLVLLHPGLRMGVLRGDVVDHPKYRGRRIFSSGINLTKIYHGKVSYLFYLVRELGVVNKLLRGLSTNPAVSGEPESTLEKLWLAVVDSFAIGGGCQLLLVVDYVIAEGGAYFNLPARKEGIIPGASNLRLARFMGERLARQAILFDKTFKVDEPEARSLVNEVYPSEELDQAVERLVSNALGSGVVSAGGNRKALRAGAEPLDTFRVFMATYALEQAFCHLSEQLTHNLEKHWNARERRL